MVYRVLGPTKMLFKEFNESGTLSLKEWHDTFIELADPTEYKPALALTGEWREWMRFKTEWPGFLKILAKWHEELEIKIRSDAIGNIIHNAKKDGASARFLAQGNWKPKSDPKKEQKIKKQVANKVDPEVERVLGAISIEASERTST